MSRIFKKVVVGISGGVDSAVAAFLLKKRGYDVLAVFMKNWDIPDETGYCSADKDFEDASRACSKLDIPITQVDFIKEYWNFVFNDLILDYQSGYTPNPDILCNRYIKFDHFFKFATDKLAADAIATGHYAQTSFGPFLENYSNKNVQLVQSKDTFKDQTFFLSQVHQYALRKTMFPIGNYIKSEVRAIARELDLEIADKHDSTGICFVGKRSFHNFISEYVPDKPGSFIDIDTGKEVGKHLGLHYWTLGQNARLAGYPKPFFIAEKDVDTNTIYVVQGTDHPFLFSQLFFTAKPHWIDPEQQFFKNGTILKCKFRFQHTKPLTDCKIYLGRSNLIVYLEEPHRAITPGQYAVFYLDKQCLGSARITKLGPNMYLLNRDCLKETNVSNKLMSQVQC